jgi:YfiH family protein
MIFADLSIYHSTLEEWPIEKLMQSHPDWSQAYSMQQVHGDHIENISELSTLTVIPECDALFSENKKQVLIIKTADCVPLAITDLKTNRFAGVHAGRAGTEKKILKKTLQTFIKQGSKPEDLYIYLGPSIGPCCYEINRDTHQVYDLWQNNLSQALELGVPAQNIHVSGICTRHHFPKKYYSYRGGDLEKRFFTVISKIQS